MKDDGAGACACAGALAFVGLTVFGLILFFIVGAGDGRVGCTVGATVGGSIADNSIY